MPVALVTGASGFLGSYVCAELLKRKFKVTHLMREGRAGQEDDVIVMSGAPTSVDMAQIIDEVAPDVIYHLAGTSRSGDISALYQANVFYAEALLQGALSSRSRPRVLLVGSAAEYGVPTNRDMTVKERDVCRPLTAYGVSKLAQTHHGLAAASKGLRVTIARLFNPIGVGSPETTALGSFVKQVAAIDRTGVLKTGNLGAVRDFIDVAEAAHIIVDLPFVTKDSGEIYNVCTGKGLALSELVSRLIDASKVEVFHQVESTRGGTSDIDVVIGNNGRLRQTGIEVPDTAIDRILEEMLKAERSRLRGSLA
ncbi:NAD-dependent epimerase/dehydratase family protein [Rhizobium sp. BR 315]|uniref:NAD-dependent epimerase/dehydratase family protein n=1 Tax=Rhizobium sp. BR 315 TaxID=3040014 RepID=UPI003D357222